MRTAVASLCGRILCYIFHDSHLHSSPTTSLAHSLSYTLIVDPVCYTLVYRIPTFIRASDRASCVSLRFIRVIMLLSGLRAFVHKSCAQCTLSRSIASQCEHAGRSLLSRKRRCTCQLTDPFGRMQPIPRCQGPAASLTIYRVLAASARTYSGMCAQDSVCCCRGSGRAGRFWRKRRLKRSPTVSR